MPSCASESWPAAGQVTAFAPTSGRQLASWVDNYFRQRNIELEPGAAQTVVDYLGSDLHRLKVELQKVELFHSGKSGSISVKQLKELLERVSVEPIWGLGPLLASGDKPAALSLLIRLLESGDEAIPMVALLARHYRQLVTARAVVEEGGGQAQLEQQLGGSPWMARKQAPQLLRQLRSLDDQQLADSLSHLVWANRYLKRTEKKMAPVLMSALAMRLMSR